ncbi:MAG: radical SAM protein YgiQ [Spirochaetes bacterium]|nr:MAG: radical SAM protein YgiQ [Spirochaetota bacterium]
MAFLPAIPGAPFPGSPSCDAIIVTGDAYVDHSSFGVALLGRLLESQGYSVAILARPDPDDVEVFRSLGKPRLAWLVSSGAVDSMVSSYTANKKLRSKDDYAPGGRPELCQRADGSIGEGIGGRKNARPDRATIAYTSLCKQAFKGVPVVLGGLEASLRRMAHFDYWSDTVRRSILLDSKADILVYCMGEQQIVEILGRLAALGPQADLRGIRGTARAVRFASGIPNPNFSDALVLPSYEEVRGSQVPCKDAYARSFAIQYANTDPHTAKRLLEPYGDRAVLQEPPAFPLEREALDSLYALPFERKAHPMYEDFGGVPGLEEVKFSLLSSRGCFGACSFCAIGFHQGKKVSSRSIASIVEEATLLSALPDFKGYIHDVGGPTANFRLPACAKMDNRGACEDRRCLAPEPCPALKVDHGEYLQLLRRLRSLPKVKKVFVRSGVRFDYAMLDPDMSILQELVEHHISGQLKVAPEHVSQKVLALMGKPPRARYDAFAKIFAKLNAARGKRQYLIPYFISAHPGSGLPEAIELAEYLRDQGFTPDQIQDFYPTPGTLATAMWWCEKNPLDGQPVYIAKSPRERAMQRALLHYKTPENAPLVREALRLANREDLIGSGPKCLAPKETKAPRQPERFSPPFGEARGTPRRARPRGRWEFPS